MSSGLGLPIYGAGRVCLASCRSIARLVGLPVVLCLPLLSALLLGESLVNPVPIGQTARPRFIARNA
jgi:hypothetical protein